MKKVNYFMQTDYPNQGIWIYEVGLSPSKKFVFVYFNESLLKLMINNFYIVSKILFCLEILTFLS